MSGEPPAISTSPSRSSVDVKLSLVADMDPVGVKVFGPAPYPLTAAPCGLCGALSATATWAARSPVPDGLDWTVTVQVAPGMTGALVHPVEPRKSPGCDPDTTTPLTGSGPFPWFATGHLFGALGEP